MGEVLQTWEERDKKILVGMEGNREKGTYGWRGEGERMMGEV